MIKAVLFDMDNTLIDFLGQKKVGAEAAARALLASGAKFKFPDAELADLLMQAYMYDLEGETVFEKFLRKHHVSRLGGSRHHLDRLVAAAVNAYVRAKFLHRPIYPDTAETLLELAKRGYRLAVLTDAPRLKAYQRLELAGIDHFFEFVMTPDDSGAHKPSPQTFRAALNSLGLEPGEVLMVGDSVVRDIAGASESGMHYAWARYGCDEVIEGDPPVGWVLSRISDVLAKLPHRHAPTQT